METESSKYALPFLSDAELRAIAAPLRQPAAIVRWFKQQGFEVKTKPNGMPLVSRLNFEYVMRGIGVASLEHDNKHRRSMPNVDAFIQRFGKKKEH